MSADTKAVAAPVPFGDGFALRPPEDREGIDGRQGEIGCKPESQAPRQKEAISCVKMNRIGNAVDGEPALAGDEGVALDTLVTAEADAEEAGMASDRARADCGS